MNRETIFTCSKLVDAQQEGWRKAGEEGETIDCPKANHCERERLR